MQVSLTSTTFVGSLSIPVSTLAVGQSIHTAVQVLLPIDSCRFSCSWQHCFNRAKHSDWAKHPLQVSLPSDSREPLNPA